jgi:hypothetical protein
LRYFGQTLSISRYRTLGLENLSHAQLNEHFCKHLAKPDDITLTSSSPEDIAWFPPSIDRDGDYWDLSDCQESDSYFLRAQIIRRKVPTEYLQREVALAFTHEEQRRGRPLGRLEKMGIRDDTRAKLLARALPATSYVEAIWENRQTLYIMTTAKKNRELMQALFVASFTKPHSGRLIATDGLCRPLHAKLPEKQYLDKLRACIPASLAIFTGETSQNPVNTLV